MRIATFNVQNMRLRADLGAVHLDGARDGDIPAERGPAATANDERDRMLTAAVLKAADADVVALQEVFDQATLDYFHDTVLVPAGAAPYPHRICLPGNDGRGQDVAAMSRRPMDAYASHAAETPASLGCEPIAEVGPHERIFRRDCLEVTVGPLALFVVHLKAPYPDREAAWRLRRLEAHAVRRLVERRFPASASALWLILGDFNEPTTDPPADGPAIAPIQDFSVDLMLRLPEGERWSHHQPPSYPYGRPDGLLASPALAHRWPDSIPRILRLGLGTAEGGAAASAALGVGGHHPHASDHAALVIDLPGI